MAKINDRGNVQVRCPGCDGAISTYEWKTAGSTFGGVQSGPIDDRYVPHARKEWRLFRCAGCGRGGLGTIFVGGPEYPGNHRALLDFVPETSEKVPLPKGVPDGIRAEFDEAERCMANGCNRAAAGLFRSVLDKTLRANGYKLKKGTPLEQQIDHAAKDGVITAARKRKAHEEIRVLGNDVLHEEWKEIPDEDVQAAQHYTQRILEDFYDDRESVVALLREAGRLNEAGEPVNQDNG